MKTKKCKKCNGEKLLGEFYKRNQCIDGLSGNCKECTKAYAREWAANNPISIKQSRKKFKQDNPDYDRLHSEQYRKNNPDLVKQSQKKWREKNPDHDKQYYINNPNYRTTRAKSKRDSDPLFKFICNIRSNLRISFKRACKGTFKKGTKTQQILGCDFDFFINYIQSRFTEGMTLDNHGEWHLDHIIPISSAKTEDDIIKLNHYTNFQPLWAEDNIQKGIKILK